jgi:hypothetical protein
LAVFENGYPAVPASPNLTRIYRIQSRPRGQLLYLMITGLEPTLPAGLRYWGHAEPTGPWSPAIELSTEPSQRPREVDGVQLTPQVAHFAYARGRIEDDQRRASHVAVAPLFFGQWIEAVDGEVIMRAEKLIADLQARVAKGERVGRALGRCVRALNKLDAARGFIGTLEAEDLSEVLIAESAKAGLASAEAGAIIDGLRDW